MAHPPDKILYTHTVLLICESDQVGDVEDLGRDWWEREFSWMVFYWAPLNHILLLRDSKDIA